MLILLTSVVSCVYYFGVKPRIERLNTMLDLEVADVDLSALEDGTYSGEFSMSKTRFVVEVTVRDHTIRDILILQSNNSKYSERAKEILPAVLNAQSLRVDAVSGATASCNAVLKAIEDALRGEGSV